MFVNSPSESCQKTFPIMINHCTVCYNIWVPIGFPNRNGFHRSRGLIWILIMKTLSFFPYLIHYLSKQGLYICLRGMVGGKNGGKQLIYLPDKLGLNFSSLSGQRLIKNYVPSNTWWVAPVHLGKWGIASMRIVLPLQWVLPGQKKFPDSFQRRRSFLTMSYSPAILPVVGLFSSTFSLTERFSVRLRQLVGTRGTAQRSWVIWGKIFHSFIDEGIKCL